MSYAFQPLKFPRCWNTSGRGWGVGGKDWICGDENIVCGIALKFDVTATLPLNMPGLPFGFWKPCCGYIG